MRKSLTTLAGPRETAVFPTAGQDTTKPLGTMTKMVVEQGLLSN